MSRPMWIAITVIAVCAIAASTVVNLVSPAKADATGSAGGRFQVAATGSFFVLVETTTSKSWVLYPKQGDIKPGWIPIKRLDSDSEVHTWKIRKSAAE